MKKNRSLIAPWWSYKIVILSLFLLSIWMKMKSRCSL